MEQRKKINLYFDFEFTSLSPYAQPISLGIVSDEIRQCVRIVPESLIDKSLSEKELSEKIFAEKLGEEINCDSSKSFYAEFTDFDLNRCDEWVKENVVGKLKFYPKVGDSNKDGLHPNANPFEVGGNFEHIKYALKDWLQQFQDYDIQFVCDCGTFDWYHLLQLIGEWETKTIRDVKLPENIEDFNMGNTVVDMYINIGLPKLPDNISPVPQDLNDMIAFKKGISVKEAFDLNREELVSTDDLTVIYCGSSAVETATKLGKTNKDWFIRDKHNSLFDAKVIKQIYNKLKS